MCAVYHAVYMDCVGIEELKCKLALLFGIQASQIGDIFMLGPSAIHIMVTDEVSPDCGCFWCLCWGNSRMGRGSARFLIKITIFFRL